MTAKHHEWQLVAVMPRETQLIVAKRTPSISASFAALLLFLALFGATAAHAQTPPPSSAGDTGVANYESYDGEHESVNMGTGNVMVSVPLLTLPGRNHLDYSVGLVFNSHNWGYSNGVWFNGGLGMNVTRTGAITLNPGPYTLVSGTQGQAGAVSCVTPYVLYDENGGQDNLFGKVACTELEEVYVPPNYELLPEPDPSADVPPSDTMTGVYMDYSGPMSNSDPYGCSLDYSNGNRIWLTNCPSGNDSISGPSVLEDANGNYISSNATGRPGGGGTGIGGGGDGFPSGTDTDTLARSITFNNSSHTVQYKDSNGVARTITLNVSSLTLSCSLPTYNAPGGQPTGVTGPTGTVHVITSAVLPDRLTYIFQYDGCGSLTKIVYPSGGYTRYVYDYTDYMHLLSSSGYPFYGPDIELTAKYVCSKQQSTYTPDSTTVGTGNTCAVTENKTAYSPTVNSSQCNHSVNTLTDPIGNQTVYNFTGWQREGGSTYLCDSLTYTLESSRLEYQGSSTSGTLLRTINTQYYGTLPSQKTTILPNGLQKQTNYAYTALVPSPTQTLEYDWGSGAPGPLLRETDVAYPTSAMGCWWRPTSRTVKNGSGTQIALTTYELDNYTSGITASGAVQHDSNFNTSLTNRCNITAVEEWRNTDGATLTTRRQFDDAGNVLSSIDPLSNVTSYSYTDNYSDGVNRNTDAYLTKTTDALGHVTQNQYYWGSGLVAASCGMNFSSSCVTGLSSGSDYVSYAYDLMGRRTSTTNGDGGKTTNCFSEMSGSCNSPAYPIDVVSTQAINSSTNKMTTTLLDGIARVTESQVNNFPGCSSTMMKVDTVYDADGRKYSVSNPYCTTSDSTYGLTKYAYDGLSRATTITHPDTTTITTAYDYLLSYTNGSTTAYQDCSIGTDENGNQHQKCDNGIGQMTAVLEPNGTTQTPTMETDYCYNMLNDMTLVMQSGGSRGSFTCTGGAGTAPSGARVRSFTYNSLSELLTSANPESGTVTYTYDNDGNVFTKTDARSEKTTYGYDTLNRLISKTYSSDSGITPWACYQYGTSTSNNQNGRLIAEWTQASGTSCPASMPSSGYFTARSTIDYDAMGLVLSENQCTPANCGTTTYPMAYTYDYAGDVVTLTDSLASTPYTLTYAYDAADHLNSVQSTWNDGQHPNSMFSTPVYQAFGLTSADIGTGETLARTYNKRGFITNETDKEVSGGATVYNYILSYYANGNVDTANDFVTGKWTYTYDTLNRVTSGVASSKSCNGMTINWTYDEWANRKSQSASGGSCSIDQPNYTINNNNTISGFSYDSSGNISTDANGNSFVYDAEGRIATVTSATTKYIYDAEGRRVAKENSGTGAVTASYALSLGGDELAEMNSAGAWQHSNIFAMGRIYATYGVEASTQVTRFHMNDWLGSRRVDLSPSGGATWTCFNYPYGDGQSCTGSDTDITEQHFTGKMRDTETGDDDFGARYYASNMGRFLTADEVRNDGNPANPQSWNLYSYVHDNPMSLVDPNGEAAYEAVAEAEAKVEQQNHDMDLATDRYAQMVDAALPLEASGFWSHLGERLRNWRHGFKLNKDLSSIRTETDLNDFTLHFSASAQHGFLQVDTDGKTSAVVPPAVGVAVNMTVDGSTDSQHVIGTGTVGIGKWGSASTDLVKDSDCSVHAQGLSLGIGASWPPFPGSVSTPLDNLKPQGENWQMLVPWSPTGDP